nr:PREDICTED: replication protein A 70 kDa DNA-binding subunit-like [Lepisosteus oculatus]
MTVKLTEGAIEALTKGSDVPNMVLQVVNIRRIESSAGPVRFRMMMSDGVHTMSCEYSSSGIGPVSAGQQSAPIGWV